jgi:hypothetical protein
MECGCGREHFDSINNYDWEPQELENLKALAQSDPKNYVEHEGCVEGAQITGLVYIRRCPCEYLWKLENLIINNDRAFAKFLNWRSARIMERAKAIVVGNVLGSDDQLYQAAMRVVHDSFAKAEELV